MVEIYDDGGDDIQQIEEMDVNREKDILKKVMMKKTVKMVTMKKARTILKDKREKSLKAYVDFIEVI